MYASAGFLLFLSFPTFALGWENREQRKAKEQARAERKAAKRQAKAEMFGITWAA